jgi:hypothetical protein
MSKSKKTLVIWALQHANQTDHAAHRAYEHGRAGNSQLWSATALSKQAAWHKPKGLGFRSTCFTALRAAVACRAMVRWAASGSGVLYMPVRLSQQRACARRDVKT